MTDLFKEKIFQVTEEQFAILELMNDRLFPYIPVRELADYVSQSVKMGKKAYEEYSSFSLLDILQKAGVEIVKEERTFAYAMPDYRIAARISYGKEKKRIEIFIPEIQKKQQVLGENEIEMDMDELIHLHLAHEFYHFLEYSSKGRAGERLKPVIVQKWSGAKEKFLQTVSEIAAHGFAYRYMDLGYPPQMIDYLLLRKEGLLSEEHFLNKLDKVKELQIEMGMHKNEI